MQTISVKSVASKPVQGGKSTCYTIEDEAGARFTGFDEGLAAVAAGTVMEIEIVVKQNGKFTNTNITAYKILSGPAGTPAPSVKPQSPQSSPRNGYSGNGEKSKMEPESKASPLSIERVSIESQTAAKIIAELAIAGKITETDPLFVCLKVWLGKRLSINCSACTGHSRVTKEQIDQLNVIKQAGKDIGARVKELGWTATKLAELTAEQAAKLIIEYRSEK